MKPRAGYVCAFAMVLGAGVAPALAQTADDTAAPAAESHARQVTDGPLRGMTIQAFSDVTFRAESVSSGGQRTPSSSFSLGQLSLFLSAPITSNISVVTETALKPGGDNRQSPTVELERVYVKYALTDAFKLAFGRTHTALGYWNEAYHHGALLQPTVARPEILRFGGVMPLHSVGVEASGRIAGPAGWDVRYIANVGNGRSREFSATQGAADANRGKATAIKVSVTHESRVAAILFGPMFYRDSIPNDPARHGREAVATETIPGAHLVVRSSRIEWVSEYFRIRHQQASPGATLDHEGWYGIATARLKRRWKPYAGIDVAQFDPADAYFIGGNTSVRRYLTGTRIDLSAHNALKVEYRREHRSTTTTDAGVFNVSFAF